MLIPVFGTPTPLTHFIVKVCRSIIEECGKDVQYIAPIEIDDLRAAWKDRDGRSVILHTDIPKREIVDLFIGLNAPTLIIVEPPIDTVLYIKYSRNIDLRGSVRYASQCISIMSDLCAFDNAHLLGSELYDQSIEYLFELISDKFGLAIEASRWVNVAARLGVSESEMREKRIASFIEREIPSLWRRTDQHTEIETKMINEAIEQYGLLLTEKSTTELVWHPEIFPFRDDLGIIVTDTKPLVGPARIMFGGHALHLPAGDWTVAVEFEVFGNLSGNRLFSQIYQGDQLLRHLETNLPLNGAFGFEIDFSISDAFYPAQVLIGIAEGAIEGALMLRPARFRRKRRS